MAFTRLCVLCIVVLLPLVNCVPTPISSDFRQHTVDYMRRLESAVRVGNVVSRNRNTRLRSVLARFVPPKSYRVIPLNQTKLTAIQSTCFTDPRRCVQQKVKTKRDRQFVQNMMVDSFTKQYQGVRSGPLVTLEARTRARTLLTKTQLAKTAIMEKHGLQGTNIKPADNGLFAGDILLTEAQADSIINAAKPPISVLPLLSRLSGLTIGGRQKRNAIYLEENLAVKWTHFPLIYTFDDSINQQERILIRRAIEDIEGQTCVRFKEVAGPPADEPHVLYKKINPGLGACGVSNVGRNGNQNVIYLNFVDCLDIVGTTIHETLHALGVQHEQSRIDRDKHIEIDYSNVDPQLLDVFESGDETKTSSYGTPYDYYSIMHYSAFVAAKDINKPTMVPTLEPKKFFTEVMGQRTKMSPRDADLLRRMYCSPECDDWNVNCGYWAQEGECVKRVADMIDVCPKSCGFCPISASELARRYLGARGG